MKASCYIWILLTLMLLGPSLASADDYLDALKSEAGELEYLDESRPGNVGHVKKQKTDKAILKASESISEFEKYYRIKDAASASIYLRLTTEDRLRIFRRFKSTRDLAIVRKMTFNLFQKQQQ